jgi:hypothetical protein
LPPIGLSHERRFLDSSRKLKAVSRTTSCAERPTSGVNDTAAIRILVAIADTIVVVLA